MISAFFSGLILILILAFFLIIFLKSDGQIGALMISDGGLQFVTLFVLIIAVILFGILSILEGRELAAILAGISGYILGRSSNQSARLSKKTADDSPAELNNRGG